MRKNMNDFSKHKNKVYVKLKILIYYFKDFNYLVLSF